MLTSLRVENFKALKDVKVDLTPMHVLIGPNDSGKTTILEALAAISRSVSVPLAKCFREPWQGQELAWKGRAKTPIGLSVQADDRNGKRLEYRLYLSPDYGEQHISLINEFCSGYDLVDHELHGGSPFNSTTLHDYNAARATAEDARVVHTIQGMIEQLDGVHLYRWEPGLLRMPNAPSYLGGQRMTRGGFGLTLVLDEILGFDREMFGGLEAAFTNVFPSVISIKFRPSPAYRIADPVDAQSGAFERAPGKSIHFQLSDGTLVPAAHASDGLLIILAYLAVLYLPKPPKLLLVEEPENGVHPARLEHVLGILRNLSEQMGETQIIMTTHSPYVLDEFEPHEVTICSKNPDGSVATRRLSESEVVQKQKDVFSLGEIWTGEGDEALSRDPSDTPPADRGAAA